MITEPAACERFCACTAIAGSVTSEKTQAYSRRPSTTWRHTLPAAKTTAPETTQMQRLAEEFRGGDVKTRSQAGQTLTYVSIDATIRRLNEVLGAAWSIDLAQTRIEPTAAGQYMATVEIYLRATVDGTPTTKFGVGAM